MKGVGLRRNTSTTIKSYGFTIVETMIVLAITGMLFVVFVLGINTRQSQAKFRQSINAVKTELDQRINEAQSGYYASASNFKCTASATSISITTGTTVEQGTNDGCVLLGTVVQFDDSKTPQEYRVYPIAGVKGKSDFSSSLPLAVNSVGSAETITLQHGLSLAWMRTGGSNIRGVAFTPSFLGIDGVPVAGGNTTQVRQVPTSGGAADSNAITSALRSSSVGEVQICLRSGTQDNVSGLITIGSGTSNSTVSLSIRGNDTCA